jgi:hypothetical protein
MSEETTPVVEKKVKKRIEFGESSMTLGDMEEFEEITGKSFSDAMRRVKVIDPETGTQAIDPDPEAKGKGLWTYEMSMKGVAAIIYVALKKENPETTLADVKAMHLDDFELVSADPTPPGASSDTSPEKSES